MLPAVIVSVLLKAKSGGSVQTVPPTIHVNGLEKVWNDYFEARREVIKTLANTDVLHCLPEFVDSDLAIL